MRLETKLTHMSKQLDLYQNMAERLRTDKRIPIEVRGDITGIMLKVREMEHKSDASVNERTKVTE